ncbi:MAG: potassium channel family protein [Candidatus Asgardarchaeia archaeon]
MAKNLLKGLTLLGLEIKYYVQMLKFALAYFVGLFLIFLWLLKIANVPLDIVVISQFLALGYNPKSVLEALALIVMFLVQTSPIMAFVEFRTIKKEEKMRLLAGKMRDHIIVVGLGHLGRRITNILLKLKIPFVVITLKKDTEEDIVRDLEENGVPIIFGDARSREVLLSAGIEHARALVTTFNDDLVCPVVAQRAKSLNEKIKVIARIYWDEFANVLVSSKYVDEVLSSTAIAVPKYILGCYYDINMEIPTTIPIKVHNESIFLNKTVAEVEEETRIAILALVRNGEIIKDEKEKIKPEDTIIFWGDIEKFKHILNRD